MDEFTQQYIETALWSSTDDDDIHLDSEKYGPEKISKETLEKMKEDCKKFQEENQEDILEDESRAGHDFWLTRNGHGAGFWDGDWQTEVGEKLTKASEKFGEFHLYVGDDGKIYH